MKILLLILEGIVAPFNVIMRSDNFIDQNKPVKFIWVFLVSLVIVAGLVLLVYKDVIFK